MHIDSEDDEHAPFFDAHCHEDPECRFITEGECYFDVQTLSKEWVRILCETGDLVVFPPGVVHRFTTTEKIHLHMIRLFRELPDYITNGEEQPGLVACSQKSLLSTAVRAN